MPIMTEEKGPYYIPESENPYTEPSDSVIRNHIVEAFKVEFDSFFKPPAGQVQSVQDGQVNLLGLSYTQDGVPSVFHNYQGEEIALPYGDLDSRILLAIKDDLHPSHLRKTGKKKSLIQTGIISHRESIPELENAPEGVSWHLDKEKIVSSVIFLLTNGPGGEKRLIERVSVYLKSNLDADPKIDRDPVFEVWIGKKSKPDDASSNPHTKTPVLAGKR